MNQFPKISVLLPTYNTAEFIGDAMASILGQDFDDFELLIVDDGSADSTEQVVRGFNDPRIKYFKRAHAGMASSLNFGLEVAQADLVVRADADDKCLPGRLRILYEFMASHPDHVLVGTDADYVDQNEDFVYTYVSSVRLDREIRSRVPYQCTFIHASVIYRKEAVRRVGGYPDRALAFQDHLLFLKLLQTGKCQILPQVLVSVRMNPHSSSIDEKWRPRTFHEIRRRCLRRGGEISEEDAMELKRILESQNKGCLKQAAYHALLAKKYLWNNHRPAMARENLARSIKGRPSRMDNYFFWILSFFPALLIRKLYAATHP